MPDLLGTVSSLFDKILGRPLRNSEASREALTVVTGVPALGLDALASTAYGPEAALAMLAPLGVAGLHYMPGITLAILALLTTLYLSYRQTAAAYPGGGGAYIVAKDNLGIRAAVIAGASLMLDYILNVAVGISAGVGAVVSAVPGLHGHTLMLCLVVLVALTFINLRGVRESGVAFGIPVLAFLLCIGVTVLMGLVRVCLSGGHPHAVVAPPPMEAGTETVSLWLMLRAFASGCTAMTGVEAVSNGVPLFQKPAVPKAQWTLTIIVGVLAALLFAISILSPAYHFHAMDERKPGYQTVLSQLVLAVAGRGTFYYLSIGTIFIILACSAQTSFADFPRVCRLLAEDGFLPSYFANLGRRLVYTSGIVLLALLSGVLLAVFDGVTDGLIPLYAIGAFGAFAFSQFGMTEHWLRRPGRGTRIKMAVNAIGAIATTIALGVIIVAKFAEGAWITMIAGPAFIALFWGIKRHYQKVAHELDRPTKLHALDLREPLIVIPIDGWNCLTEMALRFGLQMSDDVTAVHISTDASDDEKLRKNWTDNVEKVAAGKCAMPRLEIIQSPYRKTYEPILKLVRKLQKENKDRLIAVVIPELVEPHWYEYLLHNLYGAILRGLLLLDGNRRTVVIMAPWQL